MPSQQQQDSSGVFSSDKAGLWGFLVGVIVAAFIAVPLSAAFAFATHPYTQELFGGRLEAASAAGYTAFWWVVVALLASLPFLIGFGIAKLSGRTILIIGGIVVVFIVVIVILGQLFLV